MVRNGAPPAEERKHEYRKQGNECAIARLLIKSDRLLACLSGLHCRNGVEAVPCECNGEAAEGRSG
ncbi:hypothetical protein GS597_13005 [Synechococcales cyanobacterium C]|uniref:Uncharacterized protein n=1 Tax=Petrachloros mirabilis ULC683 TaxID=2781853 RepID=A0A8K1ZY25_9CYAN|nr:hypothetical protein [Petrachloros mirabilis]NCJ07410.1 hypothetical protein [Petrachloros mirabilis ULC683]